ncbi:MAG TPA: multicopper oxidase family protein [Gemmatimonadales bacterium]|jgi:FtsP/CotA-like multicopper oxidase with cupredoxin domain|nr:multicopper oxidase family protein [Gemmatimonadales bacterium]
MSRAAVVLLAAAAVAVTASRLAAQQPAHRMTDMDGGKHPDSAMAMPVPMPRGMVMMPGLVGLTPGTTPFVPGRGVDPMTLPPAKPASLTRLDDDDTLDLTAALVRRTIRGHAFAMYAFNGQVPGPLIRVAQGAAIVVRFHNRIDLPSTVHWHGVRLDNASDGAVGVTQDPVAPGGDYTYTVRFPDAGVYWYHPHVREDIEQSMGLFGNMVVDSPDADYYSPANREEALMLSDLLIQADSLIPFGKEAPDFALMGRVGNVLLVNGEPDYALRAHRGEVIRFYLTNAASSRTWNLSFGGAPIKLLASDLSRFEREAMVPSVVLGPAERYLVEVRFDRPGAYPLLNMVQAINHFRGEFQSEVDTLGMVRVDSAAATPDHAPAFERLRANTAVSKDIERYRRYFDKEPDKRLTLTVRTAGLPLATVQFMTIDTAYYAPVEWVDGMPDMNWLSTSKQVRWVLRDDATGKENGAIDWHVRRGSVVKLRIVNDPRSFHPMQHPIHLHGQRMLVVARDGVRTTNLVWKDTALIPVGSTVDLLIDASNPGAWMLHCHIAEHLGAGMMAVLHVD